MLLSSQLLGDLASNSALKPDNPGRITSVTGKILESRRLLKILELRQDLRPDEQTFLSASGGLILRCDFNRCLFNLSLTTFAIADTYLSQMRDAGKTLCLD